MTEATLVQRIELLTNAVQTLSAILALHSLRAQGDD